MTELERRLLEAGDRLADAASMFACNALPCDCDECRTSHAIIRAWRALAREVKQSEEE